METHRAAILVVVPQFSACVEDKVVEQEEEQYNRDGHLPDEIRVIQNHATSQGKHDDHGEKQGEELHRPEVREDLGVQPFLGFPFDDFTASDDTSQQRQSKIKEHALTDKPNVYSDVRADEQCDVQWGSDDLDDGIPCHKDNPKRAIPLCKVCPDQHHRYTRSDTQQYQTGPEIIRGLRIDQSKIGEDHLEKEQPQKIKQERINRIVEEHDDTNLLFAFESLFEFPELYFCHGRVDHQEQPNGDAYGKAFAEIREIFTK